MTQPARSAKSKNSTRCPTKCCLTLTLKTALMQQRHVPSLRNSVRSLTIHPTNRPPYSSLKRLSQPTVKYHPFRGDHRFAELQSAVAAREVRVRAITTICSSSKV